MTITSKLLFPAALAFAALSASAGTAPTFDKFGELSQATFGGTGISNKAVAIDTFTGKSIFGQSTGTITLGLTVTPRGSSNPAVTNNGAGVFTVDTGVDKSSLRSSLLGYSQWNVDFYIGGAQLSDLYTYELLVDIDPSTKDNFVAFDLGELSDQDSWNLGALPGLFNANKAGQYDIVLEALAPVSNKIVGETAITIDAVNVPEPASLALVGVALAGAAFAARRRKA